MNAKAKLDVARAESRKNPSKGELKVVYAYENFLQMEGVKEKSQQRGIERGCQAELEVLPNPRVKEKSQQRGIESYESTSKIWISEKRVKEKSQQRGIESWHSRIPERC